MLDLIDAAGWPIWPLILASIIALAIIGERLYVLRYTRIIPPNLCHSVLTEIQQKGITKPLIHSLQSKSPMGRVLATALLNYNQSRERIKEAVEEEGRSVAHQLSLFLTTLGTIASISPLMGLFGTIIGMIEIFGSQAPTGGSDPTQLAHGISIALYNTGFGLLVAIPSMIFWRHFRSQVQGIVLEMERQANFMINAIKQD